MVAVVTVTTVMVSPRALVILNTECLVPPVRVAFDLETQRSGVAVLANGLVYSRQCGTCYSATHQSVAAETLEIVRLTEKLGSVVYASHRTSYTLQSDYEETLYPNRLQGNSLSFH